MTLSNKITITRLILIPIMILMLFIPAFQEITTILKLSLAELLFAVLFTVASFTDFLDGYLARKRNEITDFGKFLDPIADKLLTITAMLYVSYFKTEYNFWWVLVLIVLFREFIVSAVRMVAAKKNIVIAASIYGKIKTVLTMITLIAILFNGFGLYYLMGNNAHYVTDVLFYLSVLVTFLSGLDYIVKNKNVFENEANINTKV